MIPENGDLDKDDMTIHQIESQSLDSCVDALAVVLPENDEEKIKSATLPMPTVKSKTILSPKLKKRNSFWKKKKPAQKEKKDI